MSSDLRPWNRAGDFALAADGRPPMLPTTLPMSMTTVTMQPARRAARGFSPVGTLRPGGLRPQAGQQAANQRLNSGGLKSKFLSFTQTRPWRQLCVPGRILALTWLLCCTWMPLGAQPAREFPPHAPIDTKAVLDESTLDIQVLREETLESRAHPGRKYKLFVITFFSHNWKDGPWRARLAVMIPDRIPPENAGLAAMCPGGSVGVEKGLDLQMEYGEATALQFGIPVAFLPGVAGHFGYEEIHQLSDHLTDKFLDTRDPSWLCVFPMAIVRMRAITALGKLTGSPVKSLVLMGSSITAHHGWKAAQFDPRVKGLVATGHIGCLADWMFIPESRRLRPRPPLARMALASPDIRGVFFEHVDQASYGNKVSAKLQQIVGTRDFASPLPTVSKFLSGLGMEKNLVLVPNYAHGCGSRRHVESFRMWIQYCLFERPLPTITLSPPVWMDNKALRCEARAESKCGITAEKLIYTTTSEQQFLATTFRNDAPRENYTQAAWRVVEMQRQGDKMMGEIKLEEPAPRFVAYFVDVSDEYKGVVGHSSSEAQWVERP